MTWLNTFHALNWRRMHEAFPPTHSLTALVVCVQEEVGELAAAVLGVTGEKKRKAHLTNADVLDAVADAMTYLSLVASSVGCNDLETLLATVFNMVSERAKTEIKVPMPHETAKAPEVAEPSDEELADALEAASAAHHETYRDQPGFGVIPLPEAAERARAYHLRIARAAKAALLGVPGRAPTTPDDDHIRRVYWSGAGNGDPASPQADQVAGRRAVWLDGYNAGALRPAPSVDEVGKLLIKVTAEPANITDAAERFLALFAGKDQGPQGQKEGTDERINHDGNDATASSNRPRERGHHDAAAGAQGHDRRAEEGAEVPRAQHRDHEAGGGSDVGRRSNDDGLAGLNSNGPPSPLPRYRTGRSVGRTVYVGPAPHWRLIGMFDTAGLAEFAVEAMNKLDWSETGAGPARAVDRKDSGAAGPEDATPAMAPVCNSSPAASSFSNEPPSPFPEPPAQPTTGAGSDDLSAQPQPESDLAWLKRTVEELTTARPVTVWAGDATGLLYASALSQLAVSFSSGERNAAMVACALENADWPLRRNARPAPEPPQPDVIARLEALEGRVRELESRPVT